jgi:5-methylcytosine-specific restriction endonuclease McrA
MGLRTCAHCRAGISDCHARARYCDPKCRKAAEVAKRDPDKRRAKDQEKRAERLAKIGPRSCATCGASIDHRPTHAKYSGEPCAKRAELIRDRAIRAERTRAWTQENPEYVKRWAAKNGDLRLAASRRSYRRHRAMRRAEHRAWEARNPWSAILRATRRRLRKLDNSSGLVVTPRDIRRLVGRFQGRCAYCGVRPEKLHIDHVVPIAKGGRHSIGNLLPACKTCNLSKHATLLAVWLHRREGAEDGRTRNGAQRHSIQGSGHEIPGVRDGTRGGRRRTARAAAR